MMKRSTATVCGLVTDNAAMGEVKTREDSRVKEITVTPNVSETVTGFDTCITVPLLPARTV
jgi:hypothetical protein